MSKYTTVSGDTWDIIAYKLFGHEERAKELIEANPLHALIVVFSDGITLTVPEVSAPTDYSSLPSWKQGVASAST